MGRLLVLGIGNILLTDDGVGVFAAEELMKEPWPENVTIMDGGTFTHDIFYLFEGYDELFILDIVHSGGEPGAIYQLSESDLIDKESQRLSLHDIDLIDSLRMAELLQGKRPKMRVLGMEPYDYTSWNIGLSEATTRNFAQFVALAKQEIRTILDSFEQ